jgi:hypothetical protein
MSAGNIIKLTEQYAIHKSGTLGVVVNSKVDRFTKSTESLSVLFEDGHHVTLSGNEPIMNIGHNFEFNQAEDKFVSLWHSIKEMGKAGFINEENCSDIDIVLTDSADRKTFFSVGFDKDGSYFESEPTYDGKEEGSHTVNAHIEDIRIDIDGNAWRDLEAGGYMGEFISEVVIGDQDAAEFLMNVSGALGASGEAGVVF